FTVAAFARMRSVARPHSGEYGYGELPTTLLQRPRRLHILQRTDVLPSSKASEDLVHVSTRLPRPGASHLSPPCRRPARRRERLVSLYPPRRAEERPSPLSAHRPVIRF